MSRKITSYVVVASQVRTLAPTSGRPKLPAQLTDCLWWAAVGHIAPAFYPIFGPRPDWQREHLFLHQAIGSPHGDAAWLARFSATSAGADGKQRPRRQVAALLGVAIGLHWASAFAAAILQR
jgi:hypothetical protein